jgi:hypothetical protein
VYTAKPGALKCVKRPRRRFYFQRRRRRLEEVIISCARVNRFAFERVPARRHRRALYRSALLVSSRVLFLSITLSSAAAGHSIGIPIINNRVFIFSIPPLHPATHTHTRASGVHVVFFFFYNRFPAHRTTNGSAVRRYMSYRVRHCSVVAESSSISRSC